MNDNKFPEAILEKLTRVRTIEAQFIVRLEKLGTAGAADPAAGEAFAQMSALAARHGRALEDIAGRRGTKLGDLEPAPGKRAGGRAGPASLPVSDLLEDVALAAAAAVLAYGTLYSAARLLREGEVCDLADAHAVKWRQEMQVINDLLVAAVHSELLRDGLTCRCTCPGCGLGVCLCSRNSIETLRRHWGQPGLEPGDGIALRIPPRPGSQLAIAGLDRGDRVVAVDGEVVHISSELQTALRRHPVGEAMAVQILRGGKPQEVRVAREGDLPPPKSP